jgi:GntR family transcriptional regulator
MNTIDKDSRIPLYAQLMNIIVGNIENGTLKENAKIPSERELCDIYNISRATVRRAIQELENEGYIYKLHGKGTFVSHEKFKQDLLKFYSFTDEMKRQGKTPVTKVLDFEILDCNLELANKMRIKEEDIVYKIMRLRFADDDPMMIETSYVPYDRFPGITKMDLENEAMYDLFAKRFNAHIGRAEETFLPVLTTEEEEKLFNLKKKIPSLKIERITFENEQIIEYTITIARGDRFKYHVYLKR